MQVILTSAQPTCEFSLEDEEGRFLTVPAAEPGTDDDHPPSGHGEGDEGLEIDALKEENQTFHDQVSCLEKKLEEEKTRFRELWRTNYCKCLADHNAVISAKDSEIEEATGGSYRGFPTTRVCASLLTSRWPLGGTSTCTNT